MRARQFERFLRRLSSLARRQRGRLLALLQSAAGSDRALAVIEQPWQAPCCPRCQADRCYHHGRANALQRYRCRIRSRAFNAPSGTRLE
jgi:transposase-like protein